MDMRSFVYAFMLVLSAIINQGDKDLIPWQAGHKLVWDDFRAAPDKSSPNAALTSTAINIDYSYSDTGFQFHLKCRFNRQTSWGKVKTDYILSHEQGHFDVAEIFARKLFKALKEYNFRS